MRGREGEARGAGARGAPSGRARLGVAGLWGAGGAQESVVDALPSPQRIMSCGKVQPNAAE